ncbi:MAG: NUDIX domain-containing protein [Deltaproteobacteria bacterium]|nr:NUDIX domain-containing protein [Candidatus Zymogenaceae bacterium]
MSIQRIDAPDILFKRDEFPRLVQQRLREYPHGFADRRQEIQDQEAMGVRISTSGVILLLRFSESNGYEIILTKRSAHVVQPGDLSFPGGHTHALDKYRGFLIAAGLLPCIGGKGLSEGRRSADREGFRIATDYLATALRETREETGIRPRAIRYLGALPSYGMVSFRRVIYPAVGVVVGPFAECLSWEVERLVIIGLAQLYDPDRFAWIRFDVPDDIRDASGRSEWNFPCFVSGQGREREILWGATFNMILTFLWIVLGFPIPDIPGDRQVTKEIPGNYFTGSFRRDLKEGLIREKKK